MNRLVAAAMMTLALTIVMTGAAAMQLAERPLTGVLNH